MTEAQPILQDVPRVPGQHHRVADLAKPCYHTMHPILDLHELTAMPELGRARRWRSHHELLQGRSALDQKALVVVTVRLFGQ